MTARSTKSLARGKILGVLSLAAGLALLVFELRAVFRGKATDEGWFWLALSGVIIALGLTALLAKPPKDGPLA